MLKNACLLLKREKKANEGGQTGNSDCVEIWYKVSQTKFKT